MKFCPKCGTRLDAKGLGPGCEACGRFEGVDSCGAIHVGDELVLQGRDAPQEPDLIHWPEDWPGARVVFVHASSLMVYRRLQQHRRPPTSRASSSN